MQNLRNMPSTFSFINCSWNHFNMITNNWEIIYTMKKEGIRVATSKCEKTNHHFFGLKEGNPSYWLHA